MSSQPHQLLLSFTSELLGKLAEYCHGEALFRLLCTGSRILRSKLTSASGAKSINIFRPNYTDLGSYGAVIASFKGLTSLRIILDKEAGSFPSINPMVLKTLPPTLLTIDFRFSEAEECWIYPSSRDKSGASFNASHRASFDFASSFAHLIKLKLIPTSEKLNSADPDIHLSSRDVMHLPPSLTALILPGYASESFNWSHLPNMSVLKLLMRNKVEDTEYNSFVSPLTVLELPLLRLVSEPALSALPSTLTQLNLVTSRFKSPFIAILPRHLVRLDVSYCDWQSGEDLKTLPSNLTYLSIRMWKEGPEYAEHLPKGLTHLCLISGLNPPYAGLPDSIQTLKFQDFSSACPTIEEWLALPKSLTHFSAWFTFRDFVLARYSSYSEVLPHSLVKLSLCSEYFSLDTHGFELLPDTLQILDLGWDGVFYRAKPLAILAGQANTAKSIGDWVSVHSAAQKGDLEQLMWLKQQGARFDGHGRFGLPTRDAAEFGHFEALKWLYEEAGAALNESSPIFGVWSCETAAAAAELGHLPMLSWLANHGARLRNTPSGDSESDSQLLPTNSVVHIAATKGDLSLLRWARDHNEPLDLPEYGLLPFEVAMKHDHEKAARWIQKQTQKSSNKGQ
jgi:hypothetical protein